MSRKTIEHTSTFRAIDAAGNEYTILEFTEFHEGRTSSGPNRIAGLRSLRTDNDHAVNRVEKGKYVILLDIEEIQVTSDDPHAP